VSECFGSPWVAREMAVRRERKRSAIKVTSSPLARAMSFFGDEVALSLFFQGIDGAVRGDHCDPGRRRARKADRRAERACITNEIMERALAGRPAGGRLVLSACEAARSDRLFQALKAIAGAVPQNLDRGTVKKRTRTGDGAPKGRKKALKNLLQVIEGQSGGKTRNRTDESDSTCFISA
jgi:hypothetical protein